MNAPTATSLVSIPADGAPSAPTDAPREATAADASLLADALAREINRQYRSIVDADEASDDPYALASRGRDKVQARKRTLGTTLGALKVARDRYTAVFMAWQTACAELTDASRNASQSVNVDIASVAKSLGIAFKSGSSEDPISKLAAERMAREQKEREARAAILAERKDAKLRVLAEREARDNAILKIRLDACATEEERIKLRASHAVQVAKRAAIREKIGE